MRTNQKVKSDIVSGVLFVIISIYVIIESLRFKDLLEYPGSLGPHVFPIIVGILLAFSGIVLIFKGWNNVHIKSEVQGGIWFKNKTFLLVVVIIFGYALIINHLGYSIATSIFLLSMSKTLNVNWKLAIALSVILTAVIYLLFGSLLGVPLPTFTLF
ncbi:tripartite tricarboxylate transporter TctB family protein [Tepidibacillus sp. HK-1]|uniref:tripartite tricarboxylate transporter TctB family protein n=1 Tax=Tepidibacillus sp. HK-1 TaxID=1883407 RepID=UPI00085376AC|nr:tripartite tricarboxylate transporter TctB family protein [Tepidibacillus sp. HK-1]GBF12235.1 tripartite tricarboxylate transporter TctB family protein [Tepidibacillus sp. HK-1]